MIYQSHLSQHLFKSIFKAALNWQDYRENFQGTYETFGELPLMESSTKFFSFASEYSVMRGYNVNQKALAYKYLHELKSDKLKILSFNPHTISANLSSVINTPLDKKPPSKQVSMISKLLMFLDPNKYPATDQFNRKGLTYCRYKGTPPRQDAYAAQNEYYICFMSDFDKEFEVFRNERIWDSTVSAHISKITKESHLQIPEDYKVAFEKKVFDVFLMYMGGRWKTLPRD